MELPVPESRLERGASKDRIPAITNPAFADDWSGLEIRARLTVGWKQISPRLKPDDRVIGIERDGDARAYPLRILNWHEIVNDAFGGPVLVTYCPLCRSGVTAVRTVNGTPTNFGVSGWLLNANQVLYDQLTESLWSQVVATAIRGPKTGETLSLVPSTITTWSAWRDDHPDTDVLLPPPESGTIVDADPRLYTVNPYGSYEGSGRIGLQNSPAVIDDNESDYTTLTGFHPKTLVIGVETDEMAKAYPLPAVRDDGGVVNDTVGSRPVVVAVAPGDTLVAYDRRVDGSTLQFKATGDKIMQAGKSRWRISDGRAISGPHEGTQLNPANDIPPLFWFSWLDFHPNTYVHGGTNCLAGVLTDEPRRPGC